MNAIRRILEIARKELLELRRNVGVVAFILAIPIAEMIVLGYASAGSITNLPAGVWDADRSATSRRFIQAVHQSAGFDVTALPDDAVQAERILEEGEISTLFVLPQGFERASLGLGDAMAVAAIVDGSNAAMAGHAATYAEAVVEAFGLELAGEVDPFPVSIPPRIWYNQALRREVFYIPGLLGTMLSLVVLAITAISIVRERERGTLEQLMVGPIRPVELIIGKLLPGVVIAYAELAAMLIIAIGIFDVPIRGSLALFGGMTFVYLLAEMGVGVLISTLSASQAQALPTIFLLVTTSSILAGFITPVETMPVIAQRISTLVPLRYFTTISRELFAKGAGLGTLAPQLLPLVVMSGLFFTASARLLRRRLA